MGYSLSIGLRAYRAPANPRIQDSMETRVSNPKGAVSADDVKKIARLSRLHVEDDRLLAASAMISSKTHRKRMTVSLLSREVWSRV